MDYIQLFGAVHCFHLETKQARFMHKTIRYAANLSFKLCTLELEKSHITFVTQQAARSTNYQLILDRNRRIFCFQQLLL